METFEHTFTIKTYDCHPHGGMKITSLMQQFQEVASVHAQQLNFGSDRLDEINCYWVLTNLRIEFEKLPQWNQDVHLQTWPSGHTRILATREFKGLDEAQTALFRAHSQWMILDKKSNRPKNLIRLDIDLIDAGPKVFDTELEKLEPLPEYSKQEQIHVPYSSLDLNGHVNNTEYVRWALDALRQNFDLPTEIQSLQISYLAEAFESDTLDLHLSHDHNRYFVLASKSPDNRNVFLLEIYS
jgi:acyl-ACP thioesterase